MVPNYLDTPCLITSYEIIETSQKLITKKVDHQSEKVNLVNMLRFYQFPNSLDSILYMLLLSVYFAYYVATTLKYVECTKHKQSPYEELATIYG